MLFGSTTVLLQLIEKALDAFRCSLCSGRLRRIFVHSCRSIARMPRITFTFWRRSSRVQLYSAAMQCSASCMLDWLCPSAIFLARTDGAISKRRFEHDTLICFGKGTSSVAEVSGMSSSGSLSDIHKSSDESSMNFFFRLVFPFFFDSTGHLFNTTSFVFQDGNSAL